MANISENHATSSPHRLRFLFARRLPRQLRRQLLLRQFQPSARKLLVDRPAPGHRQRFKTRRIGHRQGVEGWRPHGRVVEDLLLGWGQVEWQVEWIVFFSKK